MNTANNKASRAGHYLRQPTGYRAFIPAPLPPSPPLDLGGRLRESLSEADHALGRLDGAVLTLPNPDLFVFMYVRKEAVLSSQIEGTQSSLQNLLAAEARLFDPDTPQDVSEVANYVRAMNHGLARLSELPVSVRLIREIHAELMQGVRGGRLQPGELRTSQNWIGPAGCTLTTATFVPPPPHEVPRLLGDLERFLHQGAGLPPLVQVGLAHAQFETIHPFLDGNGRVGRLLITLLLCERKVLQRPLLYLSYYLKAHRAQYYDRLMAIRRDGDWEAWLKFFLRGVYEVSQAATETARSILALREQHRELIGRKLSSSSYGVNLLDYLFQQPVLAIRMAEKQLGCTYVTAAGAIEQMERLGILREITGRQRNRLYRYEPYLALFEQPSPSVAETAEIQTTEGENRSA